MTKLASVALEHGARKFPEFVVLGVIVWLFLGNLAQARQSQADNVKDCHAHQAALVERFASSIDDSRDVMIKVAILLEAGCRP